MAYVHFLAFDERFCGAVQSGVTRQVSPTAEGVTCPACRRKACADHDQHAAFLGHVADYCPECEQPFVPDMDDPACAAPVRPLTADERDGGARFEGIQNAGIDY